MNILIVLGNTADTGGPTKYAQQLQIVLREAGHTVYFATYAKWLWKVPFGVRHLFFALQLVPRMYKSNIALGFDTMTVGAPLMMASWITRTPYALRIGGDFVWEQFVESTGRLVKLSQFYQLTDIPFKQRFLISLTGVVARRAAALAFNASWLRDMWVATYRLSKEKTHIVENVFPARIEGETSRARIFVAAGRAITLKQEPMLRRVMERLQKRYPDISLDTKSLPPAEHQTRLREAYALVLPSVSDVAPNVVIDALTYGKPFICTDDTGIRERLEGVGIFVDTTNEAAVEAAIEALLDKDVYTEAERKVKAFTLVRSWNDVASDIEKVLTTAI